MSEEETTEIIEKTKKKYWDARHNCYAFILGQQGEISRCSDDGEPSGTAGRPILEVLAGKELTNVLVIVTRYFGGTLLGTGGLVRAYSQATQAGLLKSQLITKEVGKRITIDTDYNGVGKLQYIAAKNQVTILDTQYTDKVQMVLLVPAAACEPLKKEITESTAGQAVIEEAKEEVLFAEIDGNAVLFDS